MCWQIIQKTNFFRKCAKEFPVKLENTLNVQTKLSKNIKNWKLLWQIFRKNENFTKCADKFPQKLKNTINVLTNLSKN